MLVWSEEIRAVSFLLSEMSYDSLVVVKDYLVDS